MAKLERAEPAQRWMARWRSTDACVLPHCMSTLSGRHAGSFGAAESRGEELVLLDLGSLVLDKPQTRYSGCLGTLGIRVF